jgi:hypothetical protein
VTSEGFQHRCIGSSVRRQLAKWPTISLDCGADIEVISRGETHSLTRLQIEYTNPVT